MLFITLFLFSFPIDKCLLAVNLEYIERGKSVVLKEGDEIAVIPPISGG